MSGWTVASLIGAALAAVVLALVVVVSRAVMRTAEKARELVAALEEIQASAIVLADLEEQSAAASRLVGQTTSVLEQLRRAESSESDGNGATQNAGDFRPDEIAPGGTVRWPPAEPLGTEVPPTGEGPVAGIRRERGDAPCV